MKTTVWGAVCLFLAASLLSPARSSADCNSNGVEDAQDIAGGTSVDCDQNGAPDECQIRVSDCDGNGMLDVCELDGDAQADYGAALSIQNTQTQYGDSTLGLIDYANGSELDAAYGTIRGGVLYLVLAGNLESNWNTIDIFIDSASGGQNRLRGDNPDLDLNGLNRMGDDGSGNGLTFDAGFAPDYWLSFKGGDVGFGYYFAGFYAELPTGGSGQGYWLGNGDTETGGELSGGTNPHGIRATIDNSNTAGVIAGIGADSGAGVTTGWELSVPLSAIGDPAGAIEVCAFINNGTHDWMSNQMLGPISGEPISRIPA